MYFHSKALRLCFAGIVCLNALATIREPATSAENAGAQSAVTDKETLLRQLRSSRVDDRINALHQLVGSDRSLPVLNDPVIRAALTDLLRRETQLSTHPDLHERVDYQNYESFLLQVVQKIAQDYPSPDAWAALVYSTYAARSVFGQWLAAQPQTYPLLLQWIDDENFAHRSQAFEMLGEICIVDNKSRSKILPLLHERVGSPDSWSRQSAIGALGYCGLKEDIELLRRLPACSSEWNVKVQCNQVEGMIARRLGDQPSGQPRAEFSGPVTGKAFQATFERIGGSRLGAGAWVRQIRRGSNGSVRVDFADRDSRIIDTEGDRLIFLFASAQTALVTRLPPRSEHGTWTYREVFPRWTDERATILKQPCRKVALSDDPAHKRQLGEVWIAEDLDVALKDLLPTDSGVLIWQATAISFSEPNVSAFKIPADYSVVR